VSKSFLDRTVIETLDWGGEVLFLIAGKALHVFLEPSTATIGDIFTTLAVIGFIFFCFGLVNVWIETRFLRRSEQAHNKRSYDRILGRGGSVS
jgi:hypothetical protein